MFRIVEATSGEKGPFRTLAEGPLGRAEELTITLRDEGRALARIVLGDWSAQADTTLSPTAGWGVPVNAIEFSLSGDAPSSPASIFVTLAATSVGRGWDCVGHRAGIYRNRIRVEAATGFAEAAREDRRATLRSARIRRPSSGRVPPVPKWWTTRRRPLAVALEQRAVARIALE